MVRRVLVLNAGSSSLKSSVIDGDAKTPIARASTDWLDGSDEAGTLRRLIDELERQGADPRSFEAVGHRIVHGGARFTKSALVGDEIIAALEELGSLAPLHNPIALRTLRAAQKALPGAPQVACFDTAFHSSLEPVAYVYALPYRWFEEWGYRRFGFHGLSVAWSIERCAELLGTTPRELGVVVAHLGAGCSVSAVWQGVSVGTSMGMTPLEGVVMATRAGSVDPGVLIAALRDHKLTVADLEKALDHHSGMFGVSGRTGDMRDLLQHEARDERAALAIEIFVRSVAAGIGAAATALPRLDAIVFTGGIGENASTVRARICARLATLRLAPVPAGTTEVDSVLLREPVAVLRIEAREDVVISREVRGVLKGSVR